MGALEDPIFDPWSAEEPASLILDASGGEHAEPADPPPLPPRRAAPAPVEALGDIARPRLEAIARRLAAARHEATIDDQLHVPPHLLRFELVPRAGPFEAFDPSRSATLEIGLESAGSTRISAWYWLERGEAPDEVVSVPSDSLSSQWIDRVVLDFVQKVLSAP